MNNAKILAPRRGLNTSMAESTLVLAAGELFIEKNATTGVYKIKIGDGETQYKDLDYAFDGSGGGEAGGAGAVYGTCATAAGTAQKDVTVSADQNFRLEKGAIVAVKFTNANTASTPTLNVNNTGAKSIWYGGSAYTGSSTIVGGNANRVHTFIYDGTYWVWVSHGQEDNTTYQSKTAASGGTDVSLCTTGEKYDWNAKLNSWEGTAAQYEELTPDAGTCYFIKPS